MTFRKLLVGLADPVVAPRVMAAAAALATRQRAHLLVVHIASPHEPWRDGQSVTGYVEAVHDVYEAHRDDDAFSSEWRVIDDPVLSAGGVLAELANACDALVLGHRHEREALRPPWHLGERMIGMTRCPLLLVPDTRGRPFTAERVLVAWDNGTEIVRTVFDALPLLRTATQVRVHRFDPAGAAREHVVGTAEAFAATLSRHGVPVVLSHSDVDRFAIGDAILALAGEQEAGLVVAGARLHARAREFLFGGTTRHLLEHAARPLLLGG